MKQTRRTFLELAAGLLGVEAATTLSAALPGSRTVASVPPLALGREAFLFCPPPSRFGVLYGMKCQPELIVRIIGPNDPRYRLKRSDWARLDPARLPA